MNGKVLILCPLAVGPAWVKQIGLHNTGTVKPWKHQRDGADWLNARGSGLLAYDMGTGKSLTAMLAVLEGLTATPVLLTSGSSKQRAETLAKRLVTRPGTDAIAVIVNYESAWRGDLGAALMGVKWDAIIVDESHRLKAPQGRQSKWVASLVARHPKARRILLTGTPMPHSPLDIFAQARLIDPAIFGPSYVAFRSRYAITDRMFPSKVRSWIRQDELAKKVDSFAWRVKADDVLDLPDCIHEVLPVQLDGKTLAAYEDIERDMTAAIGNGTITTTTALTQLLRLRQATGGYARLDGSPAATPIDGTPTKRLVLQDWLEDLPATEPVVVFATFRSDLDEIAAAAATVGRPYAELSGEKNTLAAWQACDATILGVQIQSGGVGIDLTRAAYAVYYSVGHGLGDYEQSLARLRRPGQTRCVRYYHLTAVGTVDEDIYEALAERRDVVESVLKRLSPRQERDVA